MAEFNPSTTYHAQDRVSYNDLYYECLVNNPDTASTPDKGIYWKESYVKLSDIVMKGYTEGANISIVKDSTTFDMEIYGYYFDSSIEVNIPTCTINSINITPGKITLNVTSSSTPGVNNISIAKNGVPNDGVQLTLEVTDEIIGTGTAGTFLTDFNSGGTGTALWGPDWELEIFGNVNSLSRYFASSSKGTPSSGTGPSSSDDGTTYAFVETSNPNNGTGQYDSATTSNFRAIQKIEFDYFMYGADIGDFVTQGYNGTSWIDLDIMSGQQQTSQGDAWLHKTINCSNLTKIRFLFNHPTAAKGYRSDIAIDNIKITST